MRVLASGLALFLLAASAMADPLAPEPAPSVPPPPLTRATPQAAPSDVSRCSPVAASTSDKSNDGSWPVAAIASVVAALIAFAGVITTVAFNVGNTRRSIAGAASTSDANIWQKANEGEIRDLREKVDTFYGPYIQLSEINRLLADDLRARQGEPATFRLLVALFGKHWLADLPPGDAGVVAQIVANGARLEALIVEKAGSVDPMVLPYLTRAGAHYRMLGLAHAGQLGGDHSPFERYKYPRELDTVLRLEMTRLGARIDALRDRPSAAHARMEPLRDLPHLPAWHDGERRGSDGAQPTIG